LKAGATIKKIFFIAFWLCVGGGMFTLLMAAISSRNKDRCSGYEIGIRGASKNLFIDEKDVEELLKKNLGGTIQGRMITGFNLHLLEMKLEKDNWIEDAELYFDNKDLLHIRITEREPIARLFTGSGYSYYIDSSGRSIDLSEKLSARVPVITGFPDQLKNAKDSQLLNQVRKLGAFIYHDPFWMAQVAQVDINENRKFEMVPVVGNHLVRLGDGDDMAAKFRRLMIFYQQVLSKVGFEKYKLIDVQYRGQVVASRFTGNPKVDSVQLRKNVERLLQLSWEAATDTVIHQLPVISTLAPDSAIAPDPSLVDAPEVRTTPVVKEKRKLPEAVKPKEKEKEKARKPKAVMPKKD